MARFHPRFTRSTSFIALAASLAAQAAFAQDPAEGILLDAITVTGEKVERSLDETASSVVVFSGRDLQQGGRNDVTEAVSVIPNVLNIGSGMSPTIRGQDTQGPNTSAYAFFGGTVPRTSINVDGSTQDYFSLNYGSASTWDVDTIEVYRGPQTTSQGANSIAGAIIVNTKDPTFTPEGAAQVEVGSDNRRRASLAYSAPISADLAARISVDTSSRDSYVDYTGSAFSDDETDLNYESKTVRGKLLWKPTELPGFEAMLTYAHSSSNRPQIEEVFTPYDDLENTADSYPSWDIDSNSAILDASYEFLNGMKLTNQLTYTHAESDREMETFYNGTANIDRRTWTNETRLTFGDADAVWSGFGGIYLSRTESDETLYLVGDYSYDDTKTSFGAFAETTYRFTDRLSLTGGLRFQKDHTERDGAYLTYDVDYDDTFTEVLPKLVLTYEMSPQVTVGGMVSKGYNPGGVGLGFNTGQYFEYEEETVWNYELFTRARLLDDRLALTANLFYDRYTNAQRSVSFTVDDETDYATVNADKAISYGLELGAEYRPVDSLRLKAGLGLLHTEITDFSDSTADLEGSEFARAPSYTLSLGASWQATRRLTLSGDMRYVDGYYSDDENYDEYEVDGYTIVNVGASYMLAENVRLYGAVNNLTNEDAATWIHSYRGYVNGAVTSTSAATVVDPRSVSLGLAVSF
ncbi:TonB-dependent receptor [Falsirhodobacter algicola]|uniref:TonB-dependent receptor n=1 Tax=Falsirhodobacter algicola TaxID=2692330 RepID=A0A8J8SL83_9RHOB|nr:TonB-dependent receptor [Falsirhodobacter algicola]QUS36149.1 TonB-dependent receptor [Falsirhodobacter algicola]